MKQRTVVISDLHVGSVVGLWPEAHPMEGGGLASANVYQKWLLECWQTMIDEVGSWKRRPDLVINGDAVQGTSPKDGQLITNLTNVQAGAAETLLRPLRERTERLFYVRGTEWHEGKAADHVEMLAKNLGAEPDRDTGQFSRWDLYRGLDGEHGPVIHFAHHVQGSSVPWYEATVPLRDTLLLLAEMWRFYADRAPNVRMVVRSHRHRFIYVLAPPDIHVVVTPGWQLKTAFAHKKATSMLPEIGYVIIEWDGRDLTVKPRIFDLPAIGVVR